MAIPMGLPRCVVRVSRQAKNWRDRSLRHLLMSILRHLRRIQLQRSCLKPHSKEKRRGGAGGFGGETIPLPTRSDALPRLSSRIRGKCSSAELLLTTLTLVVQCVDANGLETCGGCVGDNMPGRDCTSLPGVIAVTCERRLCQICEYLEKGD